MSWRSISSSDMVAALDADAEGKPLAAEGALAIWKETQVFFSQNNAGYDKLTFRINYFLKMECRGKSTWAVQKQPYLARDFNPDLVKHLIDNILGFFLFIRSIKNIIQSIINLEEKKIQIVLRKKVTNKT